jgi:hypothetical protein
MSELYQYERDQEALKRAISQRLEEAGVLHYDRVYHDGYVRRFYERSGVLRELQIPKDAPKKNWISAERIHVEGKWRLMYSLFDIESLMRESPTIEGQAKRRQSAELWIQQALIYGCADIGLEATKEIVNTFFRSLKHQHDDDFEGDDLDWENFEWDDIR